MSIDFSTLQGLTIPEGVVTQITDAAGRVIWAVQNNEPIVLGVEKKSFSSYEGETTYSSDCVLLDIYPKTANSTVDVTYGGLTKTLTFTGTNAQTVFFGTFNGVSDSVESPASGMLSIEGQYSSFAVGTYKTYNSTTSKTSTNYCGCITSVIDWGNLTSIRNYAFYNCTNLALTELPEGITSIGTYAFYGCAGITLSSLPNSITSVGSSAFSDCDGIKNFTIPNAMTIIPFGMFFYCDGLKSVTLHDGITEIDASAFRDCDSLSSITIPNSVTSIGNYAFAYTSKDGSPSRTVTMLSTTPPTLDGTNVFDLVGMNTIVVPIGSGDAYKAAENWSTYADYIVEAS